MVCRPSVLASSPCAARSPSRLPIMLRSCPEALRICASPVSAEELVGLGVVFRRRIDGADGGVVALAASWISLLAAAVSVDTVTMLVPLAFRSGSARGRPR